MTKEIDENPFNADYSYAANCLKEAIDKEILEEIKKAAKEDDQGNHIHSQSNSQAG